MSSIKIKKEISQKFNIPTNDIRVRYDHGWWKIYIKEEHYTEDKKGHEFSRKIDEIVKNNTDKFYTFTADDGYNSQFACVNVHFKGFEYL